MGLQVTILTLGLLCSIAQAIEVVQWEGKPLTPEEEEEYNARVNEWRQEEERQRLEEEREMQASIRRWEQEQREERYNNAETQALWAKQREEEEAYDRYQAEFKAAKEEYEREQFEIAEQWRAEYDQALLEWYSEQRRRSEEAEYYKQYPRPAYGRQDVDDDDDDDEVDSAEEQRRENDIRARDAEYEYRRARQVADHYEEVKRIHERSRAEYHRRIHEKYGRFMTGQEPRYE